MAVLTCNDKQVDVPDGEPIKEYAKQLDVPFGCQAGICGTCICTVEEGMNNLQPLTEAEQQMGLDDNQRLCCQAKIKQGTVEIRI